MDQLRDLAFAKLRADGKPRFVPEVPYEKVYTDWLENLRDWTISRQLWWGHQIPAWYTPDGDVIVARSLEEAQVKSGAQDLIQDPDVLDTWFSSGLWPMSTLGWPERTPELAAWNPTHTLCTAREIITLWVSRMVMFNLYFRDCLPFTDVCIHAMIQDGAGRKMSKSLGNGVDPLELIASHGPDAMRFT